MAYLNHQCLLLVIILMKSQSMAKSCSPVSEIVSASQEEDVALSCFDSKAMGQESCYRVKWTKYGKDHPNPKVILVRPETPKVPDAKRVKWEADEKGQMSLLLTKLQKSDEGLYSCEVWHGWDCVLARNISLKVKDCKTLQPVKTTPGAPVNLYCSVNLTSDQQTVQNMTWVMLKGGKPVSLSAQTVHVSGIMLVIKSVTVSHSGWYRCQYTLGPTQRCFDINLLVQGISSSEDSVAQVTTTKKSTQAPTTRETVLKTKHGSAEVFITFVVPVIIGIVIIGLGTGLVFYCKYNKERVTEQTQWNPESFTTQSGDTYEVQEETITFTDPFCNSITNSTNQEDNRVYDEVQCDEMLTFNS
ncbi:uncharacterized protein LOC115435552 [Sphaeramia orbicularis]|uniref:uncharacterized protein LOC115435552 n=1 Tax=Sphaeramia orbicularis TaxID=375764 RepID=UPI00117D8667|nr:uncharacterized protein LOC115435552 [Sphaeramia orbicularis]